MSTSATGGPPTSPVPVIETARLRLRAHAVDDYADCKAVWSDPRVVRYIGGTPNSGEEVWKRMLQCLGLWSLLGYGYWAVEERSSGMYIGDIGFADFRRPLELSIDGMLECGWVLAPHAHGKGYATEAVTAIIAWARQHFADRRVVCIISPENVASIRVADKVGFSLWRETLYGDQPILVFSL